MKKSVKVLSSLVFALTVFAGCNAGAGNGDTIRIGGNFELSGAVAAYGIAEDEAAKLAVEEINAKGGVLGKKLDYVSYDNKSDASEATSIASRLITQDNAVVTIGPATSGLTKASLAIAETEKVSLVSPSATDDKALLKNDGAVQEYGFRLCFQDSFQGKVMANFATQNLSATKAVIIGDNSSDYAKGLAKEFKGSFAGTVVAEESYTDTEKDFSAIITSVKGKDFDVIFIPGYYQQVGLIIKQAREAGITTPIIGPDGFDSPELVSLAGASNLNDVYFSAHYSSLSTDTKVTEFKKAFEAKYSKEPNAFNALSYDTVYLIADAIERAGDATPEAVNKALAETKGFAGVTGDVTVDAEHNAVKSATVIELKEGKEANITVVKA